MRARGIGLGIGRLLGPILLGVALAACTGTTPTPEFDFASQRTTFVTHDDFDNLNPTWSPDGRTVVYVSNRSGAWNLWSIDIDGGDPRPLTAGAEEDRFPAFSPDGQRVAFASRRSGNWDVWVINRDGTGLSQLTTHRMDDLAPAWNRDSTRIAFDSYRDFEYSIYVMDADGSRQRKLTTGGNGDWGAAFAPSGNTIVFASTRTGHGDIYAIDTAGNGPYRRLTHTDKEREMIPAFSTDGSKIAFVADRDGGRDIWVMNPDGSGQVRVTRNLSGAWRPRFDVDRELYAAIGYFTVSWHPDGRSLAYTHVGRNGTGQIAILPLTH
jgi:TolB protein